MTLFLGVLLRKALSDSKEAITNLQNFRVYVAENHMHKDEVNERLNKIDQRLEQIWKAISKRGSD